ncbi:phage portal protein [Paenarthrobacter ilicis]|uniref:phage portal protein n=1 Tax=Paenarthrobacter ilicis TaxID=43665 RepID=UPI003869FC8D
MPFLQRAAEWFGIREASPSAPTGSAIVPPARSLSLAVVSADRALTLSTVFRAVQILGTSVSQLSIRVQRGGKTIDSPALIRRPCLDFSLRAFLELTVAALALSGNCYWLLKRADGPLSPVLDIEVLPAHEVRPANDPVKNVLTYWYAGKEYQSWEIKHLQYLRIPKRLKGLGPIQAAQVELRGTLEMRDYASQWFTDTDEPTGILTSDQDLNAEKAKRYRDAFKREGDFAPADGKKRDIRVLGSGLRYDPMLLKPADVQFLESQQFSTTQIARLFGISSSILLAAVEGNSQTYSNVEQDWIGYTRFTLMKYLGEIEDALTDLLPMGQRARFNIDALLRTDTKTRYEAHNLALTGKWKTTDEVRADEDLAPLTDEQKADIKATAPAPAPQPAKDAK